MAKRAIEVVLVGGGACNIQVMRAMRSVNIPGVNVTLVSETPVCVYSGMLPLVIEDKCPQEGIMVSLNKLAEYGRGKFVQARALNIDPATRHVLVQPLGPKGVEGVVERIPYDVLSLNVGSVTFSASELPGIQEYAIKTRPAKDIVPQITKFQRKWFEAHSNTPERPLRMCVVGAGMAGVELAASIKKRLERRLVESKMDNNVECTVISHLPLQKCLRCESFAFKVQRALDRRQIRTLFGPRVIKVDKELVYLDDTSTLPYDVVIYAAGAAPPPFVETLGESGVLGLSSTGFITVTQSLQTTRPEIFAAGDCITMIGHENVPKAGVYAVKEGPVMAQNIITVTKALAKAAQKCPEGDNTAWEEVRSKALNDVTPTLRVFEPQLDCLQIVNLGDGTGIGSWKGRSFEGTLIWKLKTYLDRKWVKSFGMCGATQEETTELPDVVSEA